MYVVRPLCNLCEDFIEVRSGGLCRGVGNYFLDHVEAHLGVGCDVPDEQAALVVASVLGVVLVGTLDCVVEVPAGEFVQLSVVRGVEASHGLGEAAFEVAVDSLLGLEVRGTPMGEAAE